MVNPLFTGVSAFPLTPFRQQVLDEAALQAQIARLVEAGVQSITVLGSTGCGAYVDFAERCRVTELALAQAKRGAV